MPVYPGAPHWRLCENQAFQAPAGVSFDMATKHELLSLFRHRLSSPSAFKPEGLVKAVRSERGIEAVSVPQICILNFGGDLNRLAGSGWVGSPMCTVGVFSHENVSFKVDGRECGIIARTIGGSYSVPIAEQLHVSGARV
jgi:hypothetical protein